MEAARAAAPDLSRLMAVDEAHARAAALLLAKLCFDRTAPGSGAHHQGGLKLSAAASSQLYPAIAAALGCTAADAGRRYVELADAVRRRLDARASSESGAAVVARELCRAVSAAGAGDEVPPALMARIDSLIKQFTATTARQLGLRVPRQEGRSDGN